MVQFRERINALLSDPDLTCCFRGHDHREYPVKGSFHERSGPGKRPLFTFHCPECGVVTRRAARRDYWQEHATIAAAMARGNVLPCALCFPRLSPRFAEELERTRRGANRVVLR